jgi:hypothetical protein
MIQRRKSNALQCFATKAATRARHASGCSAHISCVASRMTTVSAFGNNLSSSVSIRLFTSIVFGPDIRRIGTLIAFTAARSSIGNAFGLSLSRLTARIIGEWTLRHDAESPGRDRRVFRKRPPEALGRDSRGSCKNPSSLFEEPLESLARTPRGSCKNPPRLFEELPEALARTPRGSSKNPPRLLQDPPESLRRTLRGSCKNPPSLFEEPPGSLATPSESLRIDVASPARRP